VHTLDDSLGTVRLTPALGDANAGWRDRNDAGLSLALDGRWPEALEAFSAALRDAPSFADAPDVHALLHGNRAQAHFHCGEVQLAVESAHRALAARLVCGDAEDAPVARMRADLGVYLAACGRGTEAEHSLSAARTALEARFGEHDLRLAPVLENQARVQLLTQHPDAAEPLLLRLHALLDEHAMETATLTPLFDVVRFAREQDVTPPSTPGEPVAEEPPAGEPPAGEPTLSAAHPEGTNIEVGPLDECELFPLSAERTTFAEPSAPLSLLDDAFELLDADDYPPLRSPSTEAIRSAGLVEPGAHATPQEAPRRTHPLGFEIQYGVPQELLLDGDAA